MTVGAVAGKAGPGRAGIKHPQVGDRDSGAILKTRQVGIRRPEPVVQAGTGGVLEIGPDRSGSRLALSVLPSWGSGNLISKKTMAGGRRMTRSMAKAQRAEGSTGGTTSRVSTAANANDSLK